MQVRYCIFGSIIIIFLFASLVPRASSKRSLQVYIYQPKPCLPRDVAANSTLGFQKILVVSPGPSWRTRGLQAAANHTGIEIVIPKQPYTSNEVVKAFEELGGPDGAHPSYGSARAWLARIDMVKYVVASGFETAYIMEDDVDWDTAIHKQMSLISDNVRNFSKTTPDNTAPFGSSWDVLWLGHCGEIVEPDTERLEYPDSTLIASDLYIGWTKKWIKNIAEGHRAIQMAKQPVCAFGYGLTRNGAQNVLKMLGRGQGGAFDVTLKHQCQQGNLRCITVNPEIMHHYNPPDGTGYVSPVRQGDGKGQSSEDEVFEHIKGTTANMLHSARCEALFHNTCPQTPTSIN